MKKIVLLTLLLLPLFPVSLLAWNETAQENVLVFDAAGEPVASYHAGSWATGITQGGRVSYETWSTGNPPVLQSSSDIEISLPAGDTGVPNMINGASIPSAGFPSVSLYSFDPAMFTEYQPGDRPGLTISPSAGTYAYTIGVEIKAVSLSGTPAVEIWQESTSQWLVAVDNPVNIAIASSRQLRVRAVYNGLYSPEQILDYTIVQPADDAPLADADGDGLPDIWETANGLDPFTEKPVFITDKDIIDPFTADSWDKSSDSDGDGMSDVDELLRGTDPLDPDSLPEDSDGDGWSDWDEARRGTSPNSAADFPTATRLYEVETILSGIISDHNGTLGGAPYAVETLAGEHPFIDDTGTDGSYSKRVPAGEESFIRAVNGTRPDLVVKRYLESINDPKPADMGFTVGDCLGNIDTCAQTWQQAWTDWLDTHLVVQRSGYDVAPVNMGPIALLERQLEILSGPIPESVSEDLPTGTDSEPYLAFGSFGHRPAAHLVAELETMLADTELLDWQAAPTGTRSPRTINQLVSELQAVLESGCTNIPQQIDTVYTSYETTPLKLREAVEKSVSVMLHGDEGSYLAGLSMKYALADLFLTPTLLCRVLDPFADFDEDGLANWLEVPTLDDNIGLSDLFTADTDGDLLADNEDNCPDLANPAQKDHDQDGIGDLCDPDDDNDGLDDLLEQVFGSNPFEQDTDNDGLDDFAEWLAGTDPGIAVYITDLVSPSNQTSQIITGYVESGAAVAVVVDDPASAEPVIPLTDTTWSCQLTGMTDDTVYTISLSATDGIREGFSSEFITVDTTAPVITIETPVNGTTVNESEPILNYTSTDGTIAIFVDAAVTSITSGDGLGPLADGEHTVTVTATDSAGNIGSDTVTFIVLSSADAKSDFWLIMLPAILSGARQ